ncbi:hypothetical protein HK104_006601, partial [Borealophlyctis nickersoniae]
MFLSLPYHIVAFYLDYTHLKWAQTIVLFPTTFGGQYQFLTQLNHIFQTGFFFLAILGDIFPPSPSPSPSSSSSFRRTLRTILNHIFPITFTVATMVGILFWSVYAYDRELIMPKEYDGVYPRELNRFQHGWVAVLAWVEVVVRSVEQGVELARWEVGDDKRGRREKKGKREVRDEEERVVK